MINDNSGVNRLAIPAIGHTECIHGTATKPGYETTLFPQVITVAQRQESIADFEEHYYC